MDKSLRNQISDLLSQINEDTVYLYYDSTAFGSCRLKHWQAKVFVNNKLSTKNHNALFLEHLDKLRVAIERNLEMPLIDALLDCFGDHVVPSMMSKKRYNYYNTFVFSNDCFDGRCGQVSNLMVCSY